MKKLLIYLGITFLLFTVNGCAAVKEFSRIESVTDWKEYSGYYDSRYPELDRNERAQLLIDLLVTSKETFYVIKRQYQVEEVWVYKNGRPLWPVDGDTHVKGELMYKDFTGYDKGKIVINRKLYTQEDIEDNSLLGYRVDTDVKAHKDR